MLALVPACRLPTVTTPNSLGAISRATIVCSRVTMAAASTTGSTPRCGIEPWLPLPCTVTRTHAAVESIGPAVVPTSPAAGVVSTCWPSATSGAGTLSTRPSRTIESAPSAVSSAGWKSAR